MSIATELEAAKTSLDNVATAVAALAAPVPATVDLQPVLDALAALSAKVDTLQANVGTPAA